MRFPERSGLRSLLHPRLTIGLIAIGWDAMHEAPRRTAATSAIDATSES